MHKNRTAELLSQLLGWQQHIQQGHSPLLSYQTDIEHNQQYGRFAFPFSYICIFLIACKTHQWYATICTCFPHCIWETFCFLEIHQYMIGIQYVSLLDLNFMAFVSCLPWLYEVQCLWSVNISFSLPQHIKNQRSLVLFSVRTNIPFSSFLHLSCFFISHPCVL